MSIKKRWLILLPLPILLLLVIISCSQPDTVVLPTAVSAAQLPTDAPPTSTPLPATIDLTAVYLADNPTAIATTPAPTLTPTPVDAALNVLDPNPNELVITGQTYIVNGLLEKEADQSVWVSLVSSNGRLLAELQANINELGWRADMPIPKFITGAAEIVAVLRDADGQLVSTYRQPIILEPDRANDEQYITMENPVVNDIGVSGFNIFFDGDVKRPTNSIISLTIWGDENCQTRLARQSFELGSSVNEFYWRGFAIPSHTYAGPACAVASFGEPGAENWREAQMPITIYAPDDENAAGIRIGNPREGAEYFAGEEVFIYGTAFNISQREIFLSVLLENGRIIEQSPITTDFWGYFQTIIILPLDVEGRAQIVIETGDDDIFADDIVLINIFPAPTPTPGPPPTSTPFPSPTPES